MGDMIEWIIMQYVIIARMIGTGIGFLATLAILGLGLMFILGLIIVPLNWILKTIKRAWPK